MEAGKPVSMESIGKVLAYLKITLEDVKGLNIIPEREGE
jgi:hypothetical protein